jgi:ATP-dependent DNA ligase
MSDSFKIVGYAEGLGVMKGTLGAFLFFLSNKTAFSVSEGFTIAQRKAFWKDKTNLLGKMAEIQYREKSPDGDLMFPVFLRIKEDK